jgi:glycosyltransferase involved in cell wall biosynthesis
MSRPHKASVVIPTYNGAPTIGRTLASVAKSVEHYLSHHPDAGADDLVLVVVDDASTDDTLEVVKNALSDFPCPARILANRDNKGTSACRNQGAAATSSELLFFLDHDDEYLPDHIRILMAAMALEPPLAYVRSGIVLSDPVHPSWHRIIEDTLVLNVCVRRPCHDFIGGFYEHPELRRLRAEDAVYSDLLRRFFKGAPIGNVTLRHYRLPGNALDVQFAKFSTAPGEQPEAMGADLKVLHEAVAGIHNQRIQALKDRIRLLAATLKIKCAAAPEQSR